MANPILDTGVKQIKNVGTINFGRGAISNLKTLLDKKRSEAQTGSDLRVVFYVDSFFADKKDFLNLLDISLNDIVKFVQTIDEPKTEKIDRFVEELLQQKCTRPVCIVAVGGGITMDTAKAVANLLTNPGKAENYQGWDLVKNPAIFKVGVPTLSGTGAEATRTCVMTNTRTGLKLGMNSDHTVFNHLILDSNLTATVSRDQYFYTGMDAYIHCVEALNGSYRNALGDSYSQETLRLSRDVFNSENMMSDEARDQMMIASYLGGCAIAASYVGVVHPFSAGLSVVLGLHHCVANCIVMRAMKEFYPAEYEEFWIMVKKQKVSIPEGVCSDLTKDQYQALINATIIHEKPLVNALGNDFRKILTDEKIITLFKMM